MVWRCEEENVPSNSVSTEEIEVRMVVCQKPITIQLRPSFEVVRYRFRFKVRMPIKGLYKSLVYLSLSLSSTMVSFLSQNASDEHLDAFLNKRSLPVAVPSAAGCRGWTAEALVNGFLGRQRRQKPARGAHPSDAEFKIQPSRL